MFYAIIVDSYIGDGGFSTMFENSSDLAENKLLILYILKTLKEPISNSQLTDLVLENRFINYFTLQEYLTELEDAEFIAYKQIKNKDLITLTEKGENVLSFFGNRISPTQKELFDNYIADKIDTIKKELYIQSDYFPTKDNNFLVDLKAFEGDSILMDLKLSVPSKKHAITLCNKWQNSSSDIYNEIINYLLKDDDTK